MNAAAIPGGVLLFSPETLNGKLLSAVFNDYCKILRKQDDAGKGGER